MSEKGDKNRKNYEKVVLDMDSFIESDEHIGFIAGYNTNGVPYGLTHEEMDELKDDSKNEKTENNNIDLPF